MMNLKKITAIALVSVILTSCFKEIDIEPIEIKIEDQFTVENSIKTTQTFFRFYENIVVEVSQNAPSEWDLAFESAGDSGKVLSNYSRFAITVKTGEYNINEVTEDDVVDLIPSDDWMFDDPAYTNFTDSLSLKDWEDGEVYIIKRGTNDENDYYKIQFVDKNVDEYTFNYSKATETNFKTAVVPRSLGLAYVYFSFDTENVVQIEPQINTWHLLFTPYYGWYETLTPGEYTPYGISGALINYEGGVRVAQIFDEEISFGDINSTFIADAEFTDWKGVIGSNWKLLGDAGSNNLYIMDPVKKYLIKVYDDDESIFKIFKMRFVDYKLNGEDHYPTVEFKFLVNE